MTYTWYQLGFFLLVYAFLGWCCDTADYVVRTRKLANVGFLTLPFELSHGIIMALLVVALPYLSGHAVQQFIMTLMVSVIINGTSSFLVHRLYPGIMWPERRGILDGTPKGIAGALVAATFYFVLYKIVHPALIFLLAILPALLVRVLSDVLLIAVLADTIFGIHASRHGNYISLGETTQSMKTAERISGFIWGRLDKAYPGIREVSDEGETEYTFAKGLSMDKILWVFMTSALLGDIIETFYCGLVDGHWMNRSSVLYGPFSFVWGMGAVLLTVLLHPLQEKNDRWIFLGGFLIGGTYEYMCSVVTEILFGTVFWDYSSMPLNIGGRTNVMFCFFWGLLSVVWIKGVFPVLSGTIEKIPPLAGKIMTWVLAGVIVLDAALTSMAMIRYSIRQTDPDPYSLYDEFIDKHYPDERIEHRWPNMIVTESIQE